MCGGVAHFFWTTVKWLFESKIRHQDCLMSSAQLFYGPCLWLVAHLLTCCFSGNVPHVQVCHCTWLSFTRPSPALVLQATNAGVRRSGYDASWEQLFITIHQLVCLLAKFHNLILCAHNLSDLIWLHPFSTWIIKYYSYSLDDCDQWTEPSSKHSFWRC